MRKLKPAIFCALFFLAFTTVVSAGPPPAEFDKADSYQTAGEYEEAIQYYKIALTKTTDVDWMGIIFKRLSNCHRQLKQYDEAIKTAQMGFQMGLKSTSYPKLLPAGNLYQLAQAYRGKGQPDKAINAFKKCIEFTQAAGCYAGVAGILDDRKDYEQAIATWEKAAANDSGMLFYLARSYYYSGRYDDALDTLSKSIKFLTIVTNGCKFKIDDRYPVIKEVREGSSAQKEGLQAGDKIVKIGSKSTKKRGWNEISDLLKGKEGTQVTLKIVRKGVKKPFIVTLTQEKIIQQTAAGSFALRSLIQRHKGNADEAFKAADQAYSLNPNDTFAQLALGSSDLDHGRNDEALKLLSQVKENTDARIFEATIYAKKNDFSKAIEILSAIPEESLSPKDVPLWSDRTALLKALRPFSAPKIENAARLKGQGRSKEALKELGDALKIADEAKSEEILSKMYGIIKMDPTLSELPEKARKYALRGDAATEEGNFEAAVQEYRHAVRVAPYIGKLYFNTAMIYGKLKEYAKAIHYIKLYLQLAPEAPNARAAKDQIYKWEFMMERKK
ncbi:MAG: tetratricopeptide repeat protein [Deltaproteobacteria bacterium]|nr:tetratricopeptide repeat protein [Deltaproteobacteria bacterium]